VTTTRRFACSGSADVAASVVRAYAFDATTAARGTVHLTRTTTVGDAAPTIVDIALRLGSPRSACR
jgi:hypothetical protein